MEDLLVLVDENDNVIGTGPKLEVHQRKLLHRAFSIFLYDPGSDSMLLQQRAFGKYHSGGLWSNTCWSHPRVGETFQEALPRRLKQELGLALSDDCCRIHNASADEDPLLFPAGHKHCDDIEEKSRMKEAPAAVLEYCGRFLYLADYGELGEHEIDRVFYLSVDRSSLLLCPDRDEIADLQWMPRQAIRKKLIQQPDYFSVWFGRAFSFADAAIDRIGIKNQIKEKPE